jgi:predicted ATPase/DNA-binding SARP family transcriptional activator
MPDELQLQLLGGLGLTRAGIPLRGFLSAKVQALLCYLAVTGRPHSREALMALLWGDMPEERADHGLRQALSNLQKLAGPQVTVTRQAISFNLDAPHYLDVAKFLRLLKEADSATLRVHRRLRDAVELYAGDFLDGFYVRDAPEFEVWAAGQREWLRQMLLNALHRLAVHDISRGEYRSAAGYLERLLGLDPWREGAHRQLMLLLAYEGKRDAAAAQYHLCRRVLLENLGEEPARETSELYRQIREGTIVAPAPPIPPGNIPSTIAPTTGRQEELARIEAMLEDPSCRIVTLTGPGGVGKTQLALQVAGNFAGEFADGIYFVSLAPVRDPSMVLSTISRTLGIEESPGRSPSDTLAAALRDKEILLVVDNFEHLMSAAPQLALPVAGAPRTRLLVTSRARLRLRNEHVYDIAPLGLPPLDDPALPEVVMQYPSVAMFVERAQAARPGFAVTDANARTMAEICHRLEGLPLAIELGAARLSMMPTQALLARLEKRLAVLTNGARDLPTRQQTLRATLEWSYELLTEPQQALFRNLSVFAGGCTLDAIEVVCAAEQMRDGIVPNIPHSELHIPHSDQDLLETLTALVENSLLLREEQAGEDVRFRMLETLREYALEHLATCGEEEPARHAHALYYLRLAMAAQSELRGPEQLRWLNLLDADHNNIRIALGWARDGAEKRADDGDGNAESGLDLGMRAAAALCRFWEMRGYIIEGRQWLDDLLAQPSPAAPEARAIALRGAGILALGQGDLARSAQLCEESLSLYIQMDDTLGTAGAFNSLGNARRELGHLDTAASLYEQSLALYRKLQDPLGIAVVLNNFATATIQRGELERAAQLLEESLAIRRAANDMRGIAYTLNKLGEVAYKQGDLAHAEALCRESLQQRREMGDKQGTVLTLTTLGAILHARGEDDEAQAFMEESLALCKELGDMWGTASALRILGSVARRRGDLDQARQLLNESLSLFEENGDKQGIALVEADLLLVDG